MLIKWLILLTNATTGLCPNTHKYWYVRKPYSFGNTRLLSDMVSTAIRASTDLILGVFDVYIECVCGV